MSSFTASGIFGITSAAALFGARLFSQAEPTPSSSEMQPSAVKRITQANCVEVATNHLNNPQVLDSCGQIAELDTSDVVKEAQEDALYVPKPKVESSNTPMTQCAGKVATFFPQSISQVIQYALGFATSIFFLDVSKAPQTRYDSKSTITFFRESYKDIAAAVLAIAGYFNAPAKHVLFLGFGIFMTLIAGNRFHNSYLESKKKAELNPAICNLSQKDHVKAFGRQRDLEKLTSCICAPPGSKTLIPAIVGESGAGKTELVKTLAQEIKEGRYPRLQGKQILYVNAADAIKTDGKHMTFSQIFSALEGHENEVILFIDECHCIGLSATKGVITEQLKTKFTDSGLTFILATTKAEYNQYIKPNAALDDRLQTLDLIPLDEESIGLVLGTKCNLDPQTVEKIMTISKEKGHTSLRKRIDMGDMANNYVYNWIPRKLSITIEALEKQIEKAKQALNFNKTQAGVLLLKGLQAQLLEKKTEEAALLALHKSFLAMEELKKQYTDRRYALIHKIADAGDAAEQTDVKALAWLQQAVLPAIAQRMDDIAQQMETTYGETIPRGVDEALVEKLFTPTTTTTTTTTK